MTRGRTRGGSIATTTTHRWGGVRDVVRDDAHSLENLERLFGARANAYIFVKNRIHHKEREGGKTREAVERAARVFVLRL